MPPTIQALRKRKRTIISKPEVLTGDGPLKVVVPDSPDSLGTASGTDGMALDEQGGGVVLPEPVEVPPTIEETIARPDAEQQKMEDEARAFVLKTLRETGFLPKWYQIRRASDKAFDRAESEADALALSQANQRLAARDNRQRDIEQYNLREGWRETWTRSAILDSLGVTQSSNGTLVSLYAAADPDKLKEKLDTARENRIIWGHVVGLANGEPRNEGDRLVKRARAQLQKLGQQDRVAQAQVGLAQAQQRETTAAETLAAQQGAINARKVLIRQGIERFIDALADPSLSPDDASQLRDDFLGNNGVTDTNLIKKLSEIITAKALWFGRGLLLFPGPKAIGQGVQSPDYQGLGIVADNLRIEGIKDQQRTLVLHPDAQTDGPRIKASLNSIVNGVSSKLSTYRNKWLTGRNAVRMVVTLDVTDLPWVLDPQHLAEIQQRVGALDDVRAGRLHAVYFVVGGRATRVFPP